jgi:hypothetical protein
MTRSLKLYSAPLRCDRKDGRNRSGNPMLSQQMLDTLNRDEVIDITTIGRKSGEPRRIEIWFHRLDGKT